MDGDPRKRLSNYQPLITLSEENLLTKQFFMQTVVHCAFVAKVN